MSSAVPFLLRNAQYSCLSMPIFLSYKYTPSPHPGSHPVTQYILLRIVCVIPFVTFTTWFFQSDMSKAPYKCMALNTRAELRSTAALILQGSSHRILVQWPLLQVPRVLLTGPYLSLRAFLPSGSTSFIFILDISWHKLESATSSRSPGSY